MSGRAQSDVTVHGKWMPVQSTLIVGGGIGGLSTAIALRAKGIAVEIVELKPDLHSSVFGVGIIQPFNALRALDAIGCAQACLDAGYSTRAWGKVLDTEGNEVRQMPGATIPGSKLPPMNGITRPELHRILTSRANEVGAKIRYGTTFSQIEQQGDRVAVSFADGNASLFDLVIGADGTYSKTRSYVIAEELEPEYNGQSAFRVNIPRVIHGEMEIDRIILQHKADGMAGFVPIGPDLAYMFYNSAWEKGTRLEQAGIADVLRERMKGFGGLAGAVRDEFISEQAEIVFRPIEWMIVPAPWNKGRIVLIGDAAHAFLPHLGQGAAQAIEDGIVLAECVAEIEDIERALARYAERRFERCRIVMQGCVDIGEWEQGRLEDFDHVAVTQTIIETLIEPI